MRWPMLRGLASVSSVVLLATACKKTSAPPAPSADASASAVASASAAPSSSAAMLDAGPDAAAPPELVVPAGKSSGGVVTGSFAVRALSESSGLPFEKLVDACGAAGKFPCSESAWQRACEASPELGKAEAFTYSTDSGKLVVRGGQGGCAGRRLDAASSTNAARATLCCDRAVGIEGGDAAAAEHVAAELVVFERCVREQRAEDLAGIAAEKLFIGGQQHPREQALPAVLAALLPDAGTELSLLDTCRAGTPAGAPSTTGEAALDLTCRVVRLVAGAPESVVWRFKATGAEARLSCVDFGEAPVGGERKQRVGGFLPSGH